MLQSLGLAIADLADRRILSIMAQSLGIALLIFVGLGVLAFWLLSGSDPCDWSGLGTCPLDAGSSGFGAIILTLLAGWLLFPAVAIAVLTTFTDRIAKAVEERHYPDSAADARPIGIGRGALMGLRSAGRLLLFNLIALPFYLLLLVTGIGPFILFVIVNGLAFGRDIAELAAARHGDRTSRRVWLKSTRTQQHLLGTIVSVLFLIPFANFVAPVLGVSAAIHLFNRSSPATRRDSRILDPR
jgi:CysZ protein